MAGNVLLIEATGATETAALSDLVAQLAPYGVQQVVLLQNGYDVASEQHRVSALVVCQEDVAAAGRNGNGGLLRRFFGREVER